MVILASLSGGDLCSVSFTSLAALGDRLLGDPSVSPARRCRLRELWPIQVFDRMNLGHKELFGQFVAAVHFDLRKKKKWGNVHSESEVPMLQICIGNALNGSFSGISSFPGNLCSPRISMISYYP